jgi:hypothetical protein
MSTDNSTTNSTISYPPFFEVTDIDHGPYAVVVAFCSISLITLIAAIRFLIAGRLKIKFQLDDGTFAAAVVSFPGEITTCALVLRNHRVLPLQMQFVSTEPSSLVLGGISQTWTQTA